MKKFIVENWLKLVVAIVLLVVGASAAYYFLVLLPRQQQQASVVANNFAMQTQCASAAAKYFSDNDGKDLTYGIDSSYDDHFNSQMNKCFVLVFATTASTNFTSVSLYDALGGQEYAEFDGYSICNPVALEATGGNVNQCETNSGNIWADGNNAATSTYHVGFGGLLHGGVGDENTYTDFMAHIQPYMNN
jgi:hypothetical protein